jgi:hypothetical protein
MSLDDTILVPDTNPTSLRGFFPQQFSLLSKIQVSIFAGYFIKEYMSQKLEKDHLRADRQQQREGMGLHKPSFRDVAHRVPRVATSSFRRTFHHEGKISRGW